MISLQRGICSTAVLQLLPKAYFSIFALAALLIKVDSLRCKELGGQTGRRSYPMEQTPQPKLVPGKRWGIKKSVCAYNKCNPFLLSQTVLFKACFTQWIIYR